MNISKLLALERKIPLTNIVQTLLELPLLDSQKKLILSNNNFLIYYFYRMYWSLATT